VPTAINAAGMVIGGGQSLDLASGRIRSIGAGPANLRRDGDLGWRVIAGSSRFPAGSSMNNRGDVGYTEQGSGLYPDGIGTFPLYRLLDPASTRAGWVITGGAVKINDARAEATLGRNSATGQRGGVLLTPVARPDPPG
jgi:hypothetical protein